MWKLKALAGTYPEKVVDREGRRQGWGLNCNENPLIRRSPLTAAAAVAAAVAGVAAVPGFCLHPSGNVTDR
ncbi:hypothetical protein M0804_009716 [Polistes exclamans]|nr:hypothetical protein M0804_009716 [Polistes exclamans]